MARVEDVLSEEELETGEGQQGSSEDVGQDEPGTDLPDNASGVRESRQDMIDRVMEEGVQDGTITELAEKDGEITVEDLRKLPGAEDLTDEELLTEWNKAQAAAGGEKGEDDEGGLPDKLPFPLYDTKGNEIKDISKVSLSDFLTGKVQVGYQAMDKEQRKAFGDLVRVAQLGHHNEKQSASSRSERDIAIKQYREQKAQNDAWAQDRQVWDKALTAYFQGNKAPMEALAKAYAAELSKMPAANIPGMISESDARALSEANAAGQTFYYETIVPRTSDLAKQYGADPKEVAQTALWLIDKEPQEFLTKEKIEAILSYDLPRVIEEHGYKIGQVGPNASQPVSANTRPDPKVAQLEKQIQELSATIAKQANARTAEARSKSRRVPPAGGGSVPSAGDSMPAFKSREQMKDWLRS